MLFIVTAATLGYWLELEAFCVDEAPIFLKLLSRKQYRTVPNLLIVLVFLSSGSKLGEIRKREIEPSSLAVAISPLSRLPGSLFLIWN